MPPEIELLLCCARTQLTPEQAVRVRHLVQQNIDWRYLMKLAQWHGVTPLVYWQLKAICPHAIPPNIFKKLATNFNINIQRNFLLTSQLLKILKIFNACQIIAIPFKGTILAKTVYQNLALRQFYDIDILVDRKDFFLAKKILEECGYKMNASLTARQQNIRLKTNYEQEFFNERLKISVDLHWGVAPPYFSLPLSILDIFEKNDYLQLAGNKVSILSPEYSILILCINGAKDGWFSLQRICDVAEFINANPEIDWSRILRYSENIGCLSMLLLGLNLARDFLDAPLPKPVWIKLQQEPKIQILSEQVYHRLFESKETYLDQVKLAYFSLHLQQGILNKIRYCCGIAFPINERDLSCIALPQWLFPLYYPIRLLRLLLKYGLHWTKK